MKYNNIKIFLVLALVSLGIYAFFSLDKTSGVDKNTENETQKFIPQYENSRYREIYLDGGCFWGVQAYLDRITGVEYTNVGYTNGEDENTDYGSISKTGHAETVYVVYDPEKFSWRNLQDISMES